MILVNISLNYWDFGKMKKVIIICAKCKKQLTTKTCTTSEQDLASQVKNEDVLYSHSICFECGVNLYGRETMAKVFAKMNLPAACSMALEANHRA